GAHGDDRLRSVKAVLAKVGGSVSGDKTRHPGLEEATNDAVHSGKISSGVDGSGDTPVAARLGQGHACGAAGNRERVRAVAWKRQHTLVAQVERRLVERVLEVTTDQEHRRRTVDVCVEVAAA